MREALAAFARGELFALPMTRMLERVGIVLAIGSAARIVLVPAICNLLGFHAGYWIAFDAARIGVSETHLSLFRSGKVRGVRFSTLAKLCEALECQPADLLAYEPGAEEPEE